MSRRKFASPKQTGAERIIGLSDKEFEKWMDWVIQAGIKIKAK